MNHFAHKFVLNLSHGGLVVHLVNQSKKFRKIDAPCEFRVHLNVEPHKIREWNTFLLQDL